MNTFSAASRKGYPYLDTHSFRQPKYKNTVWFTRHTKDSERKGPAIFVGYDHEIKKWIYFPDDETTAIKNPPKEWSVADRHQLKIAKATLKMPDAIVDVEGTPVVGGPNKKEAMEIIKRLTGKYIKNPPLAVFGINPPKGEMMSRAVHEIRYKHIKDGKNYKHEFESNGVCMEALPDGSIRIFHPSKKLHGDY